MKRRNFLKHSSFLMALSPFSIAASARAGTVAQGDFEVSYTPEEWRERLDDATYDVLRNAGTERPFSTPLNDEKREGVFHCKGCDQELYNSETKYESGTGWPSFYAPLENAVATMPDRSLFSVRTEVHCDRCGGHLGHIFDDGPQPTGKRHCLNGVALTFEPTTA